MLLMARRCGYLEPLARLLLKQANKPGFASDQPRSMKDRGHLKFRRELAPAMIACFLEGTGWIFEEWEPRTSQGDVDFLMRTPSGERVAIQAKGSGRHEGSDDEIAIALANAKEQLRHTGSRTLIAICAQTAQELSLHPEPVTTSLVGRTVQYGNVVMLPSENRGSFFAQDWRPIGAVMLLDFMRAASRERQRYASTVILNPQPSPTLSMKRSYFPRSRVLELEGDRFVWHGGEPTFHGLPTGTLVSPSGEDV